MPVQKKIRRILIAGCFGLLIHPGLFAQNSTAGDFDFVYKKITTTYAGYKDKVKNGAFEKLAEQVKASADKDTFAVLSRLTSYFHDHHLSLYEKKFNNKVDTALCRLNYERLAGFTGKKHKKNRREGFWVNELNSIVIYLKEEKKNLLEGYIIETTVPLVPRGYCIIKLSEDKHAQGRTDYISVEGEFRVITTSHFKNDSVLVGNSFSKWHKIRTYTANFLQSRQQVIYKPSLTVTDSNTVLITMNNFSTRGIAKVYDSLVKANEKTIAGCKNLILDIRNNGGGSIRGFFPLLPFICERPLLHVGSFALCSDDLVEDSRESRNIYRDRKDTAMVAAYDAFIARMLANKDRFIYTPPDTFPCNPVNSKIKNVAILINHGCRSAAELMVIMLKQIGKVKTFGENTAGAVDYLDMVTYQLPVSKYTFWVGTTKRETTAAAPLYDRTGIKPDIEIPENVTDWTGFVKHYYEQIK